MDRRSVPMDAADLEKYKGKYCHYSTGNTSSPIKLMYHDP
jgi:hypothetical protein